jgi:WD40 repeat protein
MRVRTTVGVLVVVGACLLPERSVADGLKEVASFKLNDRHVQGLALSADGTRLAAAVLQEATKGKARKTNVSETVIWDLNTSAPLRSPENSGARLTYLFFSANGQTVITVDDGFNNQGGSVWVSGGLRTRLGYQAWDATTGREIGSRIAPARTGEFTTAAVSPDGRYLATVFNSEITIDRSLAHPFLVREVAVWDLQAHQVRWKLPGVTTSGRVTWSDLLAFSPDGKKLAFAINGSGGPTSESTKKAHPDRPDANLTRLKILTLEEGKQEPAVAILETGLPFKGNSLQWLSGGQFIVARGTGPDGRLLEVHDPATGQRKATLNLQPPSPTPPRAGGNPHALPGQPPRTMDAAEGWYEVQSVLSPDGSRFASHFYHAFDDPAKQWQNRVVVWDVRGRKVLGVIALPDEAPAPARFRYSTPCRDIRIALSGDGRRLAVGGPRDAVAVYDIAKLSGLVKVTPGESAAQAPAAAPDR